METDFDLWSENNIFYKDVSQYRRIISKFIYLTITMHEIWFVIGLLNQFMHKPRVIHWKGTMRVLEYIKSFPRNGCFKRNIDMFISLCVKMYIQETTNESKSITGYITFAEGILIIWSKKQIVMSRSSADSMIRLWHILRVNYYGKKTYWLGFKPKSFKPMHCDNQSTFYIAQNKCFIIVPNI